MAGDVITDDEVLVVQFEPFSFYPFVLKYDMEALLQCGYIGGGILADDTEEDGQVRVISGEPPLQIAGLAYFIQVLSCLEDIDTVLTSALFHTDLVEWFTFLGWTTE